MSSMAFLTVEIKRQQYGVETFLAADSGNRVVRLSKANGDCYDIEETATRTTCSCPDWRHRHIDSPGTTCKHVAALVELGLIQNVVAPIVEVAEVEPEATQAERSEAETETTATTYASEGLSHAIAELAAEQEAATADTAAKVRRGRPRKETAAIDWNAYGVRYAAGESYRKLAKEAGVPATRLYDRIKELGYSPAPAFAGV